ncbi:MAG: adenosylcobinamide amidohydrolase, partial [Candidatus Hodarchaeota archaeon]
MEFDVVISGVKAEIVGSECITVLFDRPLKTLSSVFFKGGFVEARSILNMHVPKSYDHEDPEGDVRRMIEKLGLPEPVIGMMTAAEMENVAVANKEEEQGELAVTAIVTAGISNAVTAGERPRFPSLENTINVILLVDANLSLGAMIGSVMVATEAKTIALRELDIRSFSIDSDYGLLTNLASGTTTDSVTVSCTSKGEMISFNTSGIELGRLIGLAVKEAVLEGLEKQEKINVERPLLDRLEERGISIEYLIKIAEDHYFP